MMMQTKYTVLIVDDDILSLNEMFEYMKIMFKTVHKASNAKEALTYIETYKPHIIFTDLEMPTDDGFSLISKIRETDAITPIVIISAYDDKEKLFKAIKLDIIDYIVKPLSSQKLKDVMKLSIKKLRSLDTEVDLGNGFTLNKDRFNLYKNGDRIPLTKNEAKLLKLLFCNINQPMHSINLFSAIWNDFEKEYNPKSIRTLVEKLRKKLESKSIIQNVYGGQYMMVIQNEN